MRRRRARRPPLIGVNVSLDPKLQRYELRPHYVEALRRAGALPVLFPMVRTRQEAKALLEQVDGVLFTGGRDLHPSLWGERAHAKLDPLAPEKQASDLLLAREALERKLPILAICYGCQLINVSLGGTLHQHLGDLSGVCRAHQKGRGRQPGRGPSRQPPGRDPLRPRAAREFLSPPGDPEPRQGSPPAVAEDGVVEAAEIRDHRFLIGVQWHPERLPGRADQRRLFSAFVGSVG